MLSVVGCLWLLNFYYSGFLFFIIGFEVLFKPFVLLIETTKLSLYSFTHKKTGGAGAKNWGGGLKPLSPIASAATAGNPIYSQ